MEHRHLLPDEIDLLLDGEVGFGVTPLKAHVRVCDRCRAELESGRRVMAELERLPHLGPSPQFADRVMSRVQVFEPWHVAATDSVRRWMPRSGPARALAGGLALGGAVSLSIATLWIVTRLDAALFVADLLLGRVRTAALSGLGNLVGTLFGEPTLDALRAGGASGVALLATAFLVALAVAFLGLRLASAASRRRRA